MSFNIKLLAAACFSVKLLDLCLLTCVRAFFCCVLLLSPAMTVHADDYTQPELAGHVSLVIGQALATNKNNEQRTLKRDDVVYSGETIETSLGGHVHLHFIDDGIVSLRPSSRLVIELYHYDKQQAKNSAIRFTLQSGVLRSISGKATEADHERFRLNTPITAIGVLGTDFIVRAEAEKVWAGVYSGAIAIAPLSEQCLASGLGTCAGATRLSELMGGVMLEFSHGKVQEKLAPFNPAILSKSKPINVESADNAMLITASLSSTSVGRITPIDIVVVDALAQQNAQKPAALSPVVQPSPFVWERWFWILPVPGDTLSHPIGSVADVHFTGAGNTYAGLYSTLPLSEVQPQVGVYDFSLAQGQVSFTGNGATNLPSATSPGIAQLTAASLQVNFGTQTFNTQMAMSYQNISSSLSLSGGIQNNGYFGLQNAAGTSTVAGSISANGGNAALAFVQQVPSGTFTGLTDWVKK